MKPKKTGQLEHRQRKNPRSYELYKEANNNENAKRPKQIWNGEKWINR